MSHAVLAVRVIFIQRRDSNSRSRDRIHFACILDAFIGCLRHVYIYMYVYSLSDEEAHRKTTSRCPRKRWGAGATSDAISRAAVLAFNCGALAYFRTTRIFLKEFIIHSFF